MYSLITGRTVMDRPRLRTVICEVREAGPFRTSEQLFFQEIKKQQLRQWWDRQTDIHWRGGALHRDFHGTTDRGEGCPPPSPHRLRGRLGASWIGISCNVMPAPLVSWNWTGSGGKSHYILQHSCGVFKEHRCGNWDVGWAHPNALSTAVK